MGVSFEDIGRGALEAGKLIVEGMDKWNQATGKSVATPTIVASTPPGGAVNAQPQGQAATPGRGLAALPGWVWLVGILGGLWYFGRKR